MNKSLEITFIGMFDDLQRIRAILPENHRHDINPHFRRGKFTGKGRLTIYPCGQIFPAIKKIVEEMEIPF